MSDKVKLPEVMVFAGPNGSGKSTITRMAKTVGEYINADDIKKTILCSDLEAAIKAEELREKMLLEKKDFTKLRRKAPRFSHGDIRRYS